MGERVWVRIWKSVGQVEGRDERRGSETKVIAPKAFLCGKGKSGTNPLKVLETQDCQKCFSTKLSAV